MTMLTWLQLRWTRFFTLAGWDWKLSTRPGFDFEVRFPCRSGECDGGHTLSVRIVDKPHYYLTQDYKAFRYAYHEPHPALFGDGPENTFWAMTHGSGGGEYKVDNWQTNGDCDELWERAAHD